MPKEESKVSIIIPCYNDDLYLEMAVNSAINQTWHNKEIILIDDGSDRKTKKVIDKLQDRVDFIITQSNNGVANARNRGIGHAKGDYILVLDSDDYFEPMFAEKAIKAFKNNPKIKLVSCYARWFKSKNNYKIFKPTGGGLKNFLTKNSSLGTMFLKKDWLNVGGYDENMTLGWEDREFYIRILKDGGFTHVIPEILFHYRVKKFSRSTTANLNRSDLFAYIIDKHNSIYRDNYEVLISYFLKRNADLEKQLYKLENKWYNNIGVSIHNMLRIIKARWTKR